MRRTKTTPPTTPPVIAPVLVELEEVRTGKPVDPVPEDVEVAEEEVAGGVEAGERQLVSFDAWIKNDLLLPLTW